MNGINFSPHFWWKSVERAVGLTEHIGKALIDGFNFREWLLKEVIEHDDLDIYDEGASGMIITNEYRYAVTNDYFFEVFTINRYGHKVVARTIEELQKQHELSDEFKIRYRFKMDDLTHFATLHFQKWLIFDKQFDWIRWQLYFDFIVSKLEGYKRGLYIYYWSVFLNEVEFQTNFFGDVNQYKQFRDRLDDILEQSKYIEGDYREQKEAEKES